MKDIYRTYCLWNLRQVSIRRPHWWLVKIGPDWWHCASRQEAIFWANVNLDLCHHIAHNFVSIKANPDLQI